MNKQPITLATLHLATEQEIFDQVSSHLLTQNRKSKISSNHMCAYRGDEGLKCAAGCLISDEEYTEKMEENSWYNLIKLGLIPEHHAGLISQLQTIHDNYDPIAWEFYLQDLAKIRNLIFQPNETN